MPVKGLELIYESGFDLAEAQNKKLQPLLNHVAKSIGSKLAALEVDGKSINVYGPDWCYENPEIAGQMHADVIVGAYGSTYALPNKDPESNTRGLRSNNLDMYLMEVDGQITGTTCLVDMGNGTAELGRSASQGRTSNGIIQDLRIFDWLTNNETAKKYHTLFTTLRTAPDREIPVGDSEQFIMRGGQAVTEHWRKFPGLTVNGFAPLYMKQGRLEQFSYSTLTRSEYDSDAVLHLDSNLAWNLVQYWHEQYGIEQPFTRNYGDNDYHQDFAFTVHYPPRDSGLTHLVHADIVIDDSNSSEKKNLADCINEAERVGSPFTQVMLPIGRNTIFTQRELVLNKFNIYGYIPGTNDTQPQLLYGRVRNGIEVVPTAWTQNNEPNPLWTNAVLRGIARQTEKDWGPARTLTDLGLK